MIQLDEHIFEIDRNHQLVNSNITFLPPWMATLSPGPPCQESEVEDRAKSLMQQFLSEAPIPAVEVPEKLVTWPNQALAMIWCHHEWWNYSSFFIININIIHHHPSSIILKTITMNHESWIISHEPSIILHLIIRHQQLLLILYVLCFEDSTRQYLIYFTDFFVKDKILDVSFSCVSCHPSSPINLWDIQTIGEGVRFTRFLVDFLDVPRNYPPKTRLLFPWNVMKPWPQVSRYWSLPKGW